MEEILSKPEEIKHAKELNNFLEEQIKTILKSKGVEYRLRTPLSVNERVSININIDDKMDTYKINLSSSNISKEILKEILELFI